MVSPLPTIVTLQQAKAGAQIKLFDDDSTLYLYLEAAHAWVLNYVTSRIGDTADEWLETVVSWDEETAPREVRAAIMHAFIFLARWRGDDESKMMPMLDNGMPPIVRALLAQYRDPSIA